MGVRNGHSARNLHGLLGTRVRASPATGRHRRPQGTIVATGSATRYVDYPIPTICRLSRLRLRWVLPSSRKIAPREIAVYVNNANAEERRRWLEPLMRGGDAGELWKLIIATMAIPTLLVSGLWNLSKSLYEKSPWLLGTALGISILFGARIKKENYLRLGAFLGEASMYFVESVINPYNECIARFNEVAPPIPSSAELRTSNARDAVLARACLQKLARTRKSPMSARKLAAECPAWASARPKSAFAKRSEYAAASLIRTRVNGKSEGRSSRRRLRNGGRATITSGPNQPGSLTAASARRPKGKCDPRDERHDQCRRSESHKMSQGKSFRAT